MKAVVVFGTSPTTGGVSSSANHQLEHLVKMGVPATGAHSVHHLVPQLPRSKATFIVNASGKRSIQLARTLVTARRDVLPYFHGESALRDHLASSSPRWLDRLDEIWVTNGEMEGMLSRCVGTDVRVVSPTPTSLSYSALRWPDRITSLVMAEWRGQPVYGLDFALSLMGTLARRGAAPALNLVSYGWHPGEDAPQPGGDAQHKFSRVVSPAREEFESLIKGSSLVLRPSLSDGDSILVRESLDWHVPVLASDVSPRPKGTFVLPLELNQWVDALSGRLVPPVSLGHGLGMSLESALAQHVQARGWA